MQRSPDNFSGKVDPPIATEPRANLGWLRPRGRVPPAVGGVCSVMTDEGDVWVGRLEFIGGRRARIKLAGSGVIATFVDCPIEALQPHSRADARQILERQRAYQPAATFKKRTIQMETEHDEIDHEHQHDEHQHDEQPEPAHAVGFRLGVDHLTVDRFRDQPESV